MKSRYCIGFFVAMFILMFLLETGYQWSYNRRAEGLTKNNFSAMESLESENEVETKGNAEKNSEYLLKELNGYVIVYLGDEKTVYEVTEILVADLPKEVQFQIEEGLKIDSTDKLYAFLENYSS